LEKFNNKIKKEGVKAEGHKEKRDNGGVPSY